MWRAWAAACQGKTLFISMSLMSNVTFCFLQGTEVEKLAAYVEGVGGCQGKALFNKVFL